MRNVRLDNVIMKDLTPRVCVIMKDLTPRVCVIMKDLTPRVCFDPTRVLSDLTILHLASNNKLHHKCDGLLHP